MQFTNAVSEARACSTYHFVRHLAAHGQVAHQHVHFSIPQILVISAVWPFAFSILWERELSQAVMSHASLYGYAAGGHVSELVCIVGFLKDGR